MIKIISNYITHMHTNIYNLFWLAALDPFIIFFFMQHISQSTPCLGYLRCFFVLQRSQVMQSVRKVQYTDNIDQKNQVQYQGRPSILYFHQLDSFCYLHSQSPAFANIKDCYTGSTHVTKIQKFHLLQLYKLNPSNTATKIWAMKP